MFLVLNLFELRKKATIGKSNTEQLIRNIPSYEIMKDGIYIATNNGCMTARKRLLTYEEGEFPFGEYGTDEFELTVPKIPFHIWEMIWEFYNDVVHDNECEASVLIYWNNNDIDIRNTIPKHLLKDYENGSYEEGKLVLYVPKQNNSKAVTNYEQDEVRKWLRDNLSIYMDTHSHNTMSAFFSGTDDANEQGFQFFTVFGRIGTENTNVIRYRYQGDWINLSIFDVFEQGEIPKGNDTTGINYPVTWWKQATFSGGYKEKTEYELLEENTREIDSEVEQAEKEYKEELKYMNEYYENEAKEETIQDKGKRWWQFWRK